MKSLFYNPDDTENWAVAPFQTHWGLTVPSSGLGVNGDIYIRHANVKETFYKKTAGAWELLSAPLQDEDYQQITDTGIKEYITSFAFETTDRLTVFQNGMRLFEGATRHFTRDTALNKIILDVDLVLALGDTLLMELN